jgi:hypothetical protein
MGDQRHCPHCDQEKDESEFDHDALVCRACEVIAGHEREFRGTAADDIASEIEGGDA